MESSDASRNSHGKNPGGPARKPAANIPGQLSLVEEVLYTGARRIDLLVDQVRDQPVRTLAIVAGALALIAFIPHG